MPRERPPDDMTASPNTAGWTLVLWMVAAFLGTFVAAHYLLQRMLGGGIDIAAATPSGWSLL